MMAMMNIEHQMELPTPRSMARTSYRVHVWCEACRHARDAEPGCADRRRPGRRAADPDPVEVWKLRIEANRFCRCGISHFRPVRADQFGTPMPAEHTPFALNEVARTRRFVVRPAYHVMPISRHNAGATPSLGGPSPEMGCSDPPSRHGCGHAPAG
jgi:hypothetical protein